MQTHLRRIYSTYFARFESHSASRHLFLLRLLYRKELFGGEWPIPFFLGLLCIAVPFKKGLAIPLQTPGSSMEGKSPDTLDHSFLECYPFYHYAFVHLSR